MLSKSYSKFYLSIVLIYLCSCDSKIQNENISEEKFDSVIVVENTIKFKNLEIYPNNLTGTFSDAEFFCGGLKNDWRLPTKKELKVLFRNKEKIGGFDSHWYMSSDFNNQSKIEIIHFGDGEESENGGSLVGMYYYRPVRTISK